MSERQLNLFQGPPERIDDGRPPVSDERPETLPSRTYRLKLPFETDILTLYLTITDLDGRPYEFFLNCRRRRVKEQLKKMGSFEYYQTSLSYQISETGEEKFVGVPEQGGKDLISPDPLAPGTIYSASVSGDGTVGMYRLEITTSSGSGKLKPAGGISGAMKESINRAFSYLLANKGTFGVAREVDTSDFYVEVIDLLRNKVEAELGVAFFVAACSVLRKAPPQPGLLVLGDMSVQGNVKAVRSLTEPLQVAMDNGAKRALIPIENKRQFLEVNPDVLEHVDPIFYGELRQAAFKALGLN